jgi:hypothetical protein
VYVRKEDATLYFASHAKGVWSAPAMVHMAAKSAEPVALAPLAGGKALLAYRALDGKIYASRFDTAAKSLWTAPEGIAMPNPSITSSPALAPGVGGAEVELVYIDAGTKGAFHTRLMGGVFSQPTEVSAGLGVLTHVAIASAL